MATKKTIAETDRVNFSVHNKKKRILYGKVNDENPNVDANLIENGLKENGNMKILTKLSSPTVNP